MKRLVWLTAPPLLLVVPQVTAAQQRTPYAPTALSASDYARAEQFVFWNAEKLTSGTSVDPRWVDAARFWYRNQVFGGHEFIMVDAAARTRRPVFDHDRLAMALTESSDESYVGDQLPFVDFELTEGGIRFWTDATERWECDLSAYRCTGPDSVARVTDEVVAPDGASAAISRDENLWVRDAATGAERQLSSDGEPHYGYGVAPEGCCQEITNRRRGFRPPAVAEWSPDGSRIATHKYDERGVAELHLLEAATGRPVLHSYRYALPGDSVIPTWELYLFDVDTGASVRADIDPMVAYFTSSDTAWHAVQWSADGAHVYFSHHARDFKTQTLVEVDAASGATRPVIVEHGDTFVELNQLRTPYNWRVLEDGNELVWFSERDGWGHLYLHDLGTGALKNRITDGSWLVVDLLHIDETAREVYFTAVGREPGRDPYHHHLYRASLDGGGVTLLTPEDAQHDISASADGRYFVDTYSTRAEAPTTVVRDRAGRVVMTVEEADITPLLEAGWEPPVRFSAKARDGVTDVYGYLWLPPDPADGVRYPVVDYIYPGPQIGPIRTPGFTTGPRGQGHALAQLGFIAFAVDAIGTPYRSKAFHDGYYGDMRDNGIPDHISALKELALAYPIDLDRVGIFGHSGGGFSSTDAILGYPDFFKVAVSGAGNHDQRGYHFPWGEKYHGLLTENPDGTDNYDTQANQNIAENLEGKLLLHYGTLDDNVHPNMTLLVAQELIEHNKDFDMLVFPNRNHGYAREPYLIRRTWDYFVEHLMGATPPKEYELTQPDS
ncbi:MAG: S9 family peptidase [Gemmatimonadetes bacterium]|nr:S9 family peptidase [Gemmatimonadota bacterium]